MDYGGQAVWVVVSGLHVSRFAEFAGAHAERRTPNAERQTPNAKRQTPNAKRFVASLHFV
jgi:hypothetical protein